MEFCIPKTIEIDTVFPLWQEAFGDSRKTVGRIIHAIAPHSKLFLIKEENTPVSMLFAVRETVSDFPVAYIYAVATKKSHRGQGLASKLLSFAEECLKSQGVSACLLSPAEKSLCDYYGKLGYCPWSKGFALSTVPAGTPVCPEEYLHLREEKLQNIAHNTPPESVLALYALTDCGAWENTRCVESLLAPTPSFVMYKPFRPDFPSSGYFSFLMD